MIAERQPRLPLDERKRRAERSARETARYHERKVYRGWSKYRAIVLLAEQSRDLARIDRSP